MTRLALLSAIVLVPSLVAPAPAAAQGRDDRSPRLGASLALGFGGELDSVFDPDGGGAQRRGDADLDPSVGFDVRAEIPVLDFLAIGGWFQFLGTLVDAPDAEREESFAFDAYVRARWSIEAIADAFFIEPYALLPIGFSMAVLPDDDGSGDDVWPGWNTGALAGAQFLHASGFGGYLEMGWRHAEVYQHYDVAFLGGADVSLVMNEFALDFGFVYAFGGH